MLLRLVSGILLSLFSFLCRLFWPPTIGIRVLSPITSVRQTRLIGAIQITDQIFQTEEGNVGNCEMDTHANTCVAGANFLACEFNGITCEVIPFSNDYESTKNVPIVSAATAWTNKESGETIILYFHQVLWYSKRLKHSLLNPNQLHHYGRSVCDDVTDKSRSFGININDEFVIPFTMTGTNKENERNYFMSYRVIRFG
jgi:hypothetical protein